MSKRLVILGAGESGTGTAILAKKQGWDVFVSDKGVIAQNYTMLLEEHSIAYESGQHTEEKILNATTVVKSPGIPDKVPLIQQLKAKGIPVIAELEFAAPYTDAKIIAITGSNGKTTTTRLVYHLLKKAGLNVGLGGNIGESFAFQVATQNYGYYVIEISSFQLDGMHDFKANVALLLNITPDHLDRYDYKFENYIASKWRIIQNQNEADTFIYCSDDEAIANSIEQQSIKAQQWDIALENTKAKGFATAEGLQLDGTLYSPTLCPLKGLHNQRNMLCALAAAKAVGIKDEVLKKALPTFVNDPHRLEEVNVVKDVLYINDSKATNVDAVYYALEAMTAPVVWIVGGVDKGNDYSQLEPLLSKIKAIVALGKDNSPIIDYFGNRILVCETDSMAKAVEKAQQLAKRQDVVLLSPACASFDLFENYMHRGNQFKTEVNALKKH